MAPIARGRVTPPPERGSPCSDVNPAQGLLRQWPGSFKLQP